MNQQLQTSNPTDTASSPTAARPAMPRRVAFAAWRRGLAAVQRRFVRARSGSVLILVVALLVLIALAGTALITTARTDRYATAQNTANTQIEMLVDAVVRLSKAQIIDDLFGGNQYRPPTPEPGVNYTPTVPGGYEHYDAPDNDTWMASRVPVRPPGGDAYWTHISAPMVTGQWFESPVGGTFAYGGSFSPQFRRRVEPWFARFGGETHPALRVYENGNSAPPVTYLAADADGDGMADSGLWRVPVGQLNGVTYYAAVRIIDNSAAFNANVHWASNRTPTAAPALPGDLFTPNVAFEKAFFQYGGSSNDFGTAFTWPGPPAGFYGNFSREWQMYGLNLYRSNDPTYTPGVTPPAGTAPDDSTLKQPPVSDANPNATRADFDWISPYDQWYHQFARRLDNPGVYLPGNPAATPPIPPRRFRTLSSEDATSLAYRFTLRNPNALVASPLEQMLLSTLEFPIDPFRPAGASARTTRTRTQPYPNPTGTSDPQVRAAVNQWFNENFDLMGESRIWSRRALTVTRNPMSNAAPVHNMQALLQNNLDVVGTRDDRMPPVNARPSTPRTSINTATFGELWRAFWMVMNAGNNSVPANASAIFRDPIRRPQPGNTTITPENMLLIRAALAAVNAEDFRDSDAFEGTGDVNQSVTSRRIYVNVNVNGNPTPTEVTVFGSEAQPFITEVYGNNDTAERMRRDPNNPDPNAPPITVKNPKGYVAVELYNPTNVKISLRGWQLGIIRRALTGVAPPFNYPSMTVMPLPGFTGFTGTSGPITIDPGQRLVLENYNGGAVGDDAAQYRPKTVDGRIGTNVKYIQHLHDVLKDGTTQPNSGELVLLRPRRGDGSYVIQQDAYGGYEYREMLDDRSAVNLDELVPLDSVDFTGFEQAAIGATQFQEMHYVRKNQGSTEDRWKCVYPGRWIETSAGFRHEGMNISELFNPPLTLADNSDWSDDFKDKEGEEIKLGTEDVEANYPNTYPGIQLNNKDFSGPNQVKTTANRFPFGGFARNGDILQVPYIGSYTIRIKTDALASPPRQPTGAGVPTGRALIVEMNPVTHDSARAVDNEIDPTGTTYAATNTYTFDDVYEQIGRFCPLKSLTMRYDPTAAPPRPNPVQPDPYAWASDLFEYLTVEAPHDDFLPNVREDNYGTYVMNPPNDAAAPIRKINPEPDKVDENDNPGTIDGKINLNTAPARVLAALTMWQPGADATNAGNRTFANGVDDTNERLANMIVRWRDGDPVAGVAPRGPFYTIHDLNRVFDDTDTSGNTRFQSAGTAIPTVDSNGYQPTTAEGDFSPRDASDEVTNDFEGRYLMLNRISNFVSTRSDSYTVYIVVQGRRGVGTASPTMVVQRRAAYLADRSVITETRRDFTPVVVPTN